MNIIKRSKPIRVLFFWNAALTFYLSINTTLPGISNSLTDIDFYIELVGSILFGVFFVWVFSKVLRGRQESSTKS